MYAYEIAKDIEERFGFSTATVTVYVVLYKMQHSRLVKSEMKKSAFGRPDRKYYEITGEGEETFQKGIDMLEETIKKLTQ